MMWLNSLHVRNSKMRYLIHAKQPKHMIHHTPGWEASVKILLSVSNVLYTRLKTMN